MSGDRLGTFDATTDRTAEQRNEAATGDAIGDFVEGKPPLPFR